MANTNQYPGLARGPIDHDASSVINSISEASINMGAPVVLHTGTIASGELLPRVEQSSTQGIATYGVAVGGDNDGVYPEGSLINAPDDSVRAAVGAGQGVVIVTRGRCLAKVSGTNSSGNAAIAVNSPLTQRGTTGQLELATIADFVLARALQPVASGDLDIIAVEVNKEGVDTDT